MSLILPKQNEFENVPAGSYAATCYRVVDFGTQYSEKFQKSDHKIMISWELDEKMKDNRPFSMHKRYTFSSSSKSNLRKDLESWRGKAFSDSEFGTFDIGVLIGIGCMIGVSSRQKDGSTYSDVSSIMKLPKGMNAPTLENETIYFSLNDFKQDVFNKLSDKLREDISKSPEYKQIHGVKPAEYHHDEVPEIDREEIPF